MMISNVKEVAEILRVLSNENRLNIVCYLLERPTTVSELHSRLNHVTQSALSQHLSTLKAHKILVSHKSGLAITYSINDQNLSKLIEVLKENYGY